MRELNAVVAATSFVVLTSTAAAQDKSLDSAGSSDRSMNGSRLEVVVVTATRRAENLQEVPITVTAVSAQQLASAGISTTRGLEQVAPGLVVAQTASSVQPTLRGIGTRGTSPGDESNVVLYLDGVYQPAMSSNLFELMNVERVEVLKGPQGTLFGRNATGGAINVITTDPSEHPVSRFSLSFARFNEINAKTYLARPLGSTASADLALQYTQDDGYIDDLSHGGKLGKNRDFTGRGRLRWQPSSDADIVVTVSHVDVNNNATYATQPINGNTRGRRVDPSVMLPNEPRQFVGEQYVKAAYKKTDVSVQTSFDMGAVLLETTSDYQTNDNTWVSDSDSTSINLGYTRGNASFVDAWSNEIRLLSEPGGRLKWVLGSMLFGAKNGTEFEANNGTRTTIVRGRQETFAYAFFGEGTYEVADRLFFTAGLRYSWEKKKFDPFVNVPAPRVDATFDSLTPRASLRYEFSAASNIYFTYSQGFKSGLFNAVSLQTTPVQPEEVTAYELGLKTEPTDWLRLNFSAFIYDYTDLQVQARDASSSSATIFQNAGSAEGKGIDVDLEIAPTQELNLRASFEYLDTRFEKFELAQITVPTFIGGVAVGGNDQIFADASGNELIRAPELTVTLGGSYTFDVGRGNVIVGANANYNDGYWLDVGNRVRQPSYVFINATIGWKSADSPFGVSVWGENLANENIVNYPIISTNGDLFSYRKPLAFGVRLSADF